MAEDLDIEAMLEAPYKKKVNKVLKVFYFSIWNVSICFKNDLDNYRNYIK